MRDEHAERIAALGAVITPEMTAATRDLYAPLHAGTPAGVSEARDLAYGPDPRHRLDLYTPGGTGRPVVVYVHGGGFVRGEKSFPGTPYYDNIGRWAASEGFVGVTMTYRLAPANRYPDAAADIGRAIGWLRANVAAHGGDPDAIVLVGQSAGAAHAGMYVARPDLSPGGAIGVAAVALFSGIYDFSGPERGANLVAYLGDDTEATAAAASSVDALAHAPVPLLVVVSEFDPPAFHAQAKRLTDVIFAQRGRFADVLYLPRHNHISQVAHLGARDTGDPVVAARLGEFVRVAARQAAARPA